MAIQSIEQNSLGGGLGRALGTGLGGGLGGLLAGLAEGKAQQLQERHNRQGLESVFGPKTAQLLQSLPPESQKAALQNIDALLKLESTLGANQPMQQLQQVQQQIMPSERQLSKSSLSNLTPKQISQLKEYIGTPKASKTFTPQQLALLQNQLSQPIKNVPQQEMQNIAAAPVPQNDKAAILKDVFTSPHEKREEEKLGIKRKQLSIQEKKLEHDMKKEALNETKEIRKELFSKKKAARDTIDSINELEALEKEGLPGAGYIELLKSTGLDIPALMGAPAEEYNKVAANFIRNAKSVFGNRLTDTDLELFLKTVPSLSNSPEGRKRINATLKRVANLDIAMTEAYENIVKKNGGIPPLDLDLQLDKALDKKREAVHKQFRKDLAKNVPEGESPLATALLAGTGKLVGKIPSAIKGATAGAQSGAILGSVFPGIGTTTGTIGGAALGGLGGLFS